MSRLFGHAADAGACPSAHAGGRGGGWKRLGGRSGSRRTERAGVRRPPPPEGSALAVIAGWRGPDGEVLMPEGGRRGTD